MSRFLRTFYMFFVAVLFVGNAFAAGYTCDSYKQYESCNVGYYMVGSASSSTWDGTKKPGNACKACNGTYCPGGTAAPLYKVTLNVNGGTAGSVTAIYASKSAGWYTGTTSSSAGTKITSLTTAQLPTRSGRRFTGFWTATSGGTKWIDADGTFVSSTSYTNVTGAMILYAQWYDGCLENTYKDGDSCPSCPTSHPYSPQGSTSINACYASCTSGAITNGTKTAVNTTASYGSSCSYTVSCNTNYYAAQSPSTNPTCTACPSSHPKSSAGSVGVAKCYATCTPGTIANGTITANSASVYYNNSCSYTTTCDANYYKATSNGTTTCTACPTSHPYSPQGSTSANACYTNCSKTSITNGTVSAVNSTEKYSTSCSYNVTCNTGYTAAASPSTNPTCNANCVKVTLDSGDANQDGTLYTRYNDKTSWYSDASCSTKITNITIPTYSGWTFAGYYSTSTAPLKYTADGTLPAATYRGVGYNNSLITATPGSYAAPTTWYARWAQNCQSSATATCSGPIYTNATLKISYVNCCLVGYHNSNYANTDDADSYGVCK